MKTPFLATAMSCALVCSPLSALAWDGYDYESGSFVEIDKGNLVRSGRDIEYFDYGSGEYRYGTVESINGYSNSVEVEVYDHQDGTYRTFEMDRPSPSAFPGAPGLPRY